MEVNIQSGKLSFSLSKGADRLDELLGFASRENPKRRYLFVSKVLGKHIPVKPSVMRSVYRQLAAECEVGSSAFVVGMAETATGLGAGVADSLARIQKQNSVVYQHTTRHRLSGAVWLTLEESHSHAVDLVLYEPRTECRNSVFSSKRLILVDDEISTGRTLCQLAEKLLHELGNIEELLVVSIVNWLDREHRAQFAELPAKVRFVSLLEGTFTFVADSRFVPELPKRTDTGPCSEKSREDLGRKGVLMPFDGCGECLDLNRSQQYTVVGTGEHLFLPFLMAEKAEQQGVDVLFQSTTRSPILQGDAIDSKIAFSDEGRDVLHFVYNLPQDRTTVVVCESEELQRKNGLVCALERGL